MRVCVTVHPLPQESVGNKVILWKVKDHNGVWHWWCETPDGEVIDLTKEQYELNNNPVPSTSRASKLKEQGRIMSFKSYQKRLIL